MSRGPGRRPGSASSRAALLAAARAEFEERGYDRATVRAIAGRAGVDPAMIHHFFGTKERLFVAALQLPLDPQAISEAIADGPRSTVGERAVRTFLAVWEDPEARRPLLAVLRSAMSHPTAAEMLRQFVSRALLGRLRTILDDVPDAELRLEAMVSQLVGMAVLRYVVRVEPLASAPADTLAELIGPVVQRYVDER